MAHRQAVQVVVIVHHDGRTARQLHAGVQAQLDLAQDKFLVGTSQVDLSPLYDMASHGDMVDGAAVGRGKHALAMKGGSEKISAWGFLGVWLECCG